jgi:ligand-binding sensor domain-containing protein
MLVGAQSGLYVYNVASDRLELFESNIFSTVQLSRYDINCMCEDSCGLLWIGTRNGLFIYNPYTREINVYTQKNGLASDLVQSILEDADNNIWVATNKGLTCVRVTTNIEMPGYFYNFISYDSSDGLQGEQFNYNAAYLTSRSELICWRIFWFQPVLAVENFV